MYGKIDKVENLITHAGCSFIAKIKCPNLVYLSLGKILKFHLHHLFYLYRSELHMRYRMLIS